LGCRLSNPPNISIHCDNYVAVDHATTGDTRATAAIVLLPVLAVNDPILLQTNLLHSPHLHNQGKDGVT